MWFRKPYPVLRECIANLKGDRTAFEGVVWGRRGDYLVLRNARQLRDEGRAVSREVAGEVAIPMANIEFVQVME